MFVQWRRERLLHQIIKIKEFQARSHMAKDHRESIIDNELVITIEICLHAHCEYLSSASLCQWGNRRMLGVMITPKDLQAFEALEGAPKIFSRDKSCRAIWGEIGWDPIFNEFLTAPSASATSLLCGSLAIVFGPFTYIEKNGGELRESVCLRRR